MHLRSRCTAALCAVVVWSVFSCPIVGRPRAVSAADWKPAPCPLMTPWGERLDPEHVWPEYPRPMMVRDEWANLNGLWQFEFIDEAKRPDDIPFGRDLEGRILVPFPWESALSGIRKFHPQGRAWYRRTFRVPETWTGKRILLNFEAVDWECAVFVDGEYAGGHRGGYDPFSIDITDDLADRDTHELLVYVYDPGSDRPIARGKQSNGKFDDPQGFSYTPSSGIWQTVWLEP
ncbi:MAG: glycoside hydrolase family 2, partial [Planctomycetota bacterium]